MCIRDRSSDSLTASSSVPVVQQPAMDSAREDPLSNTSPPRSDAGDAAALAPTSVTVVDNSTSGVIAATDNVEMPEQTTLQHEAVVPTATGRPPVTPSLLDVKRQRQQARERQRHMVLHGSPVANSSNVSAMTNGAMTNGVDSASSSHRIEDSTSYVGTRPKYSNRYDIAAPDKKDHCCIMM